MTGKEKDCGCIGEFHREGCKCTCTDNRRDQLCVMHQNAAESLPAQSELKCDLCGQPKNDGGIHKQKQGYGDFESIGCSWLDRSPVAPASTNSPAIPAKEICNLECADDLSLKCCLELGHYQEYHSDGHTDWLTTAPEVEAKDNPTKEREQEALNVTPTFGRPTVEEVLEEWAEGRTYGKDSHFIREFSKWTLKYIASLKVSQPSDQPTQKVAQVAEPKPTPSTPAGTWPSSCVQRAFVEGMKWWQWKMHRSTAFGSEVNEAEVEAVKRYGEPQPEYFSECCKGAAPAHECYINCGGTKPNPKPQPASISSEPTQKEAQGDYLLGQCLPLLNTLAHYGNKQAKELRKEIIAYANAALSHKEKL